MRRPTRLVKFKARVPWLTGLSEGGLWIGTCDDLGLTVQSETWGELMAHISTALQLMMEDLASTGDLRSFVQEQGWDMLADIPESDDLSRGSCFDIPFIPQLVERLNDRPEALPA